MTDHHDDLIREALEAEAEGVTAGDDLLARIQDRTRRSSSRWRRAPWLLGAAAALVAVVGLAVAAIDGDGGQQLEVTEDPSAKVPAVEDLLPAGSLCDGSSPVVLLLGLEPGTSEAEVREVGAAIQAAAASTGTTILSSQHVDQETAFAYLREHDRADHLAAEDIPSYFIVRVGGDDLALRGEINDLPAVVATVSETCGDETADTPPGTEILPAVPTSERPRLVTLVREDGWLITVDLVTGEQRELHFGGDPSAEDEVGMTSLIDAVELSADGEWIYFSTCCEPAVGTTYRIPVTGGEPEQVAQGAFPRVSPDGRYLAVAAGSMVSIVELGGTGTPVSFEVAGSGAGQVEWSPDGTQLAFVDASGLESSPQVRVLDWDGATLAESDMGRPDNPGRFVAWHPDGTLNVVTGEPIAQARSLSQDTSHQWLLWVDEEGVVREQAGFESGDRTPIDGLPRALAADW